VERCPRFPVPSERLHDCYFHPTRLFCNLSPSPVTIQEAYCHALISPPLPPADTVLTGGTSTGAVQVSRFSTRAAMPSTIAACPPTLDAAANFAGTEPDAALEKPWLGAIASTRGKSPSSFREMNRLSHWRAGVIAANAPHRRSCIELRHHNQVRRPFLLDDHTS